MKKRNFLTALFLALLVSSFAVFCVSCDWLEASIADDTEITVRNTTSALSTPNWYITEIEIRDDSNRQVYYAHSNIRPGEGRTIDVDGGGTFRIAITVQQKAMGLTGSSQRYSASCSVANGNTRTASFNGSSFSID